VIAPLSNHESCAAETSAHARACREACLAAWTCVRPGQVSACRAAACLLPLKTESGLWRLFADDPATVQESSGTAGIATALAIGVRRGWLGAPEAEAARRALAGLEARLTPDGFLPGTAPESKREGGEPFRRRAPGSILPFGLGLLAQLVAELR
jgi:unsaturated rhamnogalacturonyl hydrolase